MANKHMNIYSTSLFLSLFLPLTLSSSLSLSVSLSLSLSLFIYIRISATTTIYINMLLCSMLFLILIALYSAYDRPRPQKTPDLPTHTPQNIKKTQIPSPSQGRKIGNNCCRVVAPDLHTCTCVCVHIWMCARVCV